MNIGEHHNMLTALSRSTRKTRVGNYYWWFRCDCGTVKEILPSNTTRKKNGIKSCGCLAKSKHHGKIWLTRMIYDYKKHAEKLGVPYELSREWFEALTNNACVYCGDSARSRFHNGIDRADPEKGYTLDNCVSCCKVCNYMKRKLSVTEFVSHIHKISKMFSTVNSVI